LGAAVTEAEWDACTDPLKLLDFLLGRTSKEKMLAFLHGRPSDRKARLFAVACCRRVWHLLTDERGRRAVEVSERYADGLASREEMEAAYLATDQAPRTPMQHEGPRPPRNLLSAAHFAAHPKARVVTHSVAQVAAGLAWAGTGGGCLVRYAEEQAHQCVILRDIFGSLFRPARVDPAWLAREGGTVPRLAAAVYEERAFARMPILADALEEAGCTDADILGHLRGPGPHVRGCWVLDLLLWKT
jgi:hypothetical protein